MKKSNRALRTSAYLEQQKRNSVEFVNRMFSIDDTTIEGDFPSSKEFSQSLYRLNARNRLKHLLRSCLATCSVSVTTPVIVCETKRRAKNPLMLFIPCPNVAARSCRANSCLHQTRAHQRVECDSAQDCRQTSLTLECLEECAC